MKDSDCVDFLQWALPKMHMQWQGFRKVRKQVCKRIDQRLNAISLSDIRSYRNYLKTHTEEWSELSNLCGITISRFYRDKKVFSSLQKKYLPNLLNQLSEEDKTSLNIWCIGCSSGEEPYTLNILWQQILSKDYPNYTIDILATDIDDNVLKRAEKACYSYSSIKNLPVPLLNIAFTRKDETYCLKPKFKHGVVFKRHDVREEIPHRTFDVILCRNLVFTYFDIMLQKKVLAKFRKHLIPNGLLVLGVHERLPNATEGFIMLSDVLAIYQRK